jgi:TPR repeat protein
MISKPVVFLGGVATAFIGGLWFYMDHLHTQSGFQIQGGALPIRDTFIEEPYYKTLKTRAEAGDPHFQMLLGQAFYEGGRTLARDDVQAALWTQKAAEQGNLKAKAHWAFFHLTGVGVPKDEKQGYLGLKKAAEEGDLFAQGKLGIFLIDRDLERALYWLQKAAADNPEAQYALAVLYREGAGLEKHAQVANAWAQRAANKGHPRALLWVADLQKDRPQVSYNLSLLAQEIASERFDRLRY